MHEAFRNFTTTAAAAAILVLTATGVHAQRAPSTLTQEMLVKVSLLSFNDANLTGNYSVLHARLSKRFRDQYPPEKLAATFKGFRDDNIDLDIVAAKRPISVEEATVDNDGVLTLKGYFDTQPNRVNYALEYVMSDGEWKLFNISVRVKAPQQAP
jgi:hypothetical protein